MKGHLVQIPGAVMSPCGILELVPINPGALCEALRFVDCHCCATAKRITGPQCQWQIARRICFIAALSKSDFDEPADGPSFQAELAFPYNSFVRLA
jgi:hypothetical protein